MRYSRIWTNCIRYKNIKKKISNSTAFEFENQFHSQEKKSSILLGCSVGCRVKANCPLLGPGPAGGVPSVGSF